MFLLILGGILFAALVVPSVLVIAIIDVAREGPLAQTTDQALSSPANPVFCPKCLDAHEHPLTASYGVA